MTEYAHVVIRGDSRRAKGFLIGAAAGAGIRAPVFGTDEARREGRRSRLFAASLHLAPQLTEALVPVALIPVLERALAAAGPGRLALESARKVRRARFAFKFRLFARPAAAALRERLDGRPAAVDLTDFEASEFEDPQATAVELYSPAHHYQFCGSGRLEGPAAGILDLHDALLRLSQVKVEPIDLDLE